MTSGLRSTRRDAWAASFHEVLSLSSPRTDCPIHLPDPPPPAKGDAAVCATHGGVLPPELTRRQRRRLERFSAIHGIEVPSASYESQVAAEAWLAAEWKMTLSAPPSPRRDEL